MHIVICGGPKGLSILESPLLPYSFGLKGLQAIIASPFLGLIKSLRNSSVSISGPKAKGLCAIVVSLFLGLKVFVQ